MTAASAVRSARPCLVATVPDASFSIADTPDSFKIAVPTMRHASRSCDLDIAASGYRDPPD